MIMTGMRCPREGQMPLSEEFKDFVINWLYKSDQYDTQDIKECFDKFFTLYIVFNRVYAEATFTLERRGQINLKEQTSFPDRRAATDYCLQLVGAKDFVTAINSDTDACQALQEVVTLLNNEQFYIKLSIIRGEPQPQEDRKLLKKLQSNSSHTKGKAILDTIYSLRCNMFHGQKGFHQVQHQLLLPVIILLKKTISVCMEKLEDVNN
jgi:hypothetical protein